MPEYHSTKGSHLTLSHLQSFFFQHLETTKEKVLDYIECKSQKVFYYVFTIYYFFMFYLFTFYYCFKIHKEFIFNNFQYLFYFLR